MNREIKFKAIRKDGKGWVYGDYFNTSKSSVCNFLPTIIENGGMNPTDFHLVIPETVCQFTGLLDKNGKEIYEGDMVYRNGHQRIVVFKDGAFCLEGIKKYDGSLDAIIIMHAGSVLYNFISGIEVIGNIHEGKENK